MLKIKLSPPHIVNKKYVVFIDIDAKKLFTSKKLATDFITQVEKELNEALLFINESYCNLTSFYHIYFLADRDFRFKYEVENCFDLIDNRLNYISSHTQSENFNTIISQALNLCFSSLIEICESIDIKSRHRYDMLTRRRIELHKKVITQYRDSFKSFKIQSFTNVDFKIKTA